ncbi:MAG: phosphoribosylformylglycinamidine synthase subunit PurL [Elusimicrobiota bacterium]
MSTATPVVGAPALSWLEASPKTLQDLNTKNGWSLSLLELQAIQSHFRRLKREPTHAEIETLAQTWSEHCKHKTLTSPVRLRDGKSVRAYKNPLAETIMAATRKLKKPWCLSVFEDNAGVVDFDGHWALAYKVETHNHPCALEPYGGAETGVGGVIRDVLGVGLGAKPVLNTDIFCLCRPDHTEALPEDVLHPRRTLSGIVSGVRDYGNRMGIPTAAGGIHFDADYRFNPLVFVGTVGLMPSDCVHTKILPGDLVVAAGGRTGRDGLHGATFSSAALDEGSDASAVQIGHAIMEKRVLDALLRARDARLYRAVTDCGAGGFSSAVGELAERVEGRGGVRVDLSKAPLKLEGLAPWEIWLSEAQERMVFAVPPKNLKALQAIMAAENVETCVLGTFTATGRLEVFNGEERVADLELEFLHHGLPRKEQAAQWDPPKIATSARPRVDAERLTSLLHQALSHPNVCSREWVIRQYDHEVQGGTVIKPLQGTRHDGPGDACVIWPLSVTNDPLQFKGFSVAHGLRPDWGRIDPYAMAFACVDEALANLACAGADVSRAAILDNFCWGDPNDPRQMGSLIKTAEGCRDAALQYETPFISGKDSLHNVYRDSRGKTFSIPGTLLISAVAPVPDVRKAMTLDIKGPRNAVYLLGRTTEELGASLLASFLKLEGPLPKVSARENRDAYRRLGQAMQKGSVLAAHDLSEGGLAVAAAEMAFSGEFGIELDLDRMACSKGARDEAVLLFAETPGRILIEVDPEKEKDFLKAMKGSALTRIGCTLANPVLRVKGLDGRIRMEAALEGLKESWQTPLPKMMLVQPPHNGGSR